MTTKNAKNHPPPTVVDLDRDKLVFCDNLSGTTFAFAYPPGAFKDMEVLNREELDTKLRTFITDKKLSPTNLVFVLSPTVYFSKDLPHLSEEERTNQTHKFLDMVPFSSVSSKMFHLGNDYKLVAINRDFYDTIRRTFELLGFSVQAVIPSFILGSMGVKDSFDIEACRVILKRMDYVLENSFLTPEPPHEGIGMHRQYIKKHPWLFALLSLIPLGLLGLTTYLTLRRPTQVTPPVSRPPVIVVEPTSLPTPTPEGTPSAQLTVQVLNGSGTPGQAATIQSALEALGFLPDNISTGDAKSTPSQALVIYSAKVPNSLRDKLGDLIKEFSPTFSAQEVASPAYDIIITTARAPTPTPQP